MSFWQISAGNGPVECELAVAKFLQWIQEREKVEILEMRPGYEKGTLKSAAFLCDADLSPFCGSIRWTCQSPFRPGHKRKNWFINFMGFDEKAMEAFDEGQVSFQTMRSSGNGGQNVNKVESSVRAIYLPTGLTVVCQDERSQHMNRKRALDRLKLKFLRSLAEEGAADKKDKWSQHNQLQRGGEVAAFEGEKFRARKTPEK